MYRESRSGERGHVAAGREEGEGGAPSVPPLSQREHNEGSRIPPARESAGGVGGSWGEGWGEGGYERGVRAGEASKEAVRLSVEEPCQSHVRGEEFRT